MSMPSLSYAFHTSQADPSLRVDKNAPGMSSQQVVSLCGQQESPLKTSHKLLVAFP